MAIARVECASWEMDPKLMAPVANLLQIFSAGSTSSIEMDGRFLLKWNKLLSVAAFH
jgi:hypothetical protein